MKKIFLIINIFIIFALSACAKGKYASNRLSAKNNKVNNVLEEQVNKEDDKNIQKNDSDNSKIKEQKSKDQETEKQEEKGKKAQKTSDSGVDYDLSSMDSDMVYASVYQLMVEPSSYVGKTFKMQGIYYATYYEPTKKYYHYIIIQDALACCAQGIEFVWDDGSHVYPDEYPKNDSKIEIVGTFETYKEDNDDRLYCRIVNAKMKLIS